MKEITVEIAATDVMRDEVFTIRKKVFVEEQGVDENIEYDEHEMTAVHILARFRGEPVGAARVRFLGNGFLKVERMAVLKDFRKKDIGGHILRFCEDIAVENNCKGLFLHAQCRVKGFYEKHGYIEEGNIFKEAKIEHVAMRKLLQP